MRLVVQEKKTVRGKQELAQQISVQNRTIGLVGLAPRSASFLMPRRHPISEAFLVIIAVVGKESGSSLISPHKLTAKNHTPVT